METSAPGLLVYCDGRAGDGIVLPFPFPFIVKAPRPRMAKPIKGKAKGSRIINRHRRVLNTPKTTRSNKRQTESMISPLLFIAERVLRGCARAPSDVPACHLACLAVHAPVLFIRKHARGERSSEFLAHLVPQGPKRTPTYALCYDE